MKLRTLVIILVGILCRIPAHAQDKPSTDSLASGSDSTLQMDSLLMDLKSMLDSIDYNKSFVSINVTVGNSLFSLRNNDFNSQQEVTNRISVTPTVSYNHKTGLGLTGAAYLIFDPQRPGFYQYALSPSYDYVKGSRLGYGISYTHYFTNDGYKDYTTPFKNEFFGYIHGKRGWLRPGLSAGWAKGEYEDIYVKDTTIFGIRRKLIDTTHTTITDISLTASFSHDFEWDDVFAKDDNLTLSPVLYVGIGAQQYDIHSKYKLVWLATAGRIARKFKRSSTQNTGLQFQSLAFSLNLSYYIGSFVFSPEYYVSYYLPSTTANRWSNIFGLTAGYIF